MSRKPKDKDTMSFKEAATLNLRAFLILWRANPRLFVSIAAQGIVSALTPYVGIYLSALIINEIAGSREPQTLRNYVLFALISAVVLALINAALTRWKNSEDSAYYLNQQSVYINKLLHMDFCSVDDTKTYDILSQIRQNDQWSGWGFSRVYWSFINLINSITTIAGAIALSITLFTLRVPDSGVTLTSLNNPFVVALVILLMLGATLLSPIFSNKAVKYWVDQSDDARMNNRMFSFFGFMGYKRERALDIRMYRQDKLCIKKYGLDGGFTASKIAANARGPMGGLYALSAVVSQVSVAIVYVFVCLKALGGAFGVGSVTQYIAAITALSGGVAKMLTALGDLKNNGSFLRTTFEFLDIPNPMYQGSLTIEKRSDRRYEIEFRNVSFKYPGTEAYALRNLSLKFNVGQRLAVVGMNGSGKTTFIKLLCRLYDPTEGVILLNGIDIRKYSYHEYQSIFSVVFQDFKLLAFTLGQNVAASSDVDAKKATACLAEAGFSQRLSTLEKGLDTPLYKSFDDGGVEISGGEAQKIAIARALYKDAAFVILDEPTAALDPIAEFEVYSRMNEMVGGKTAVFISHRLSSCRFCHDIAVFHEGELVQRGSHDELVSDESGKYHELWHAQAQYYSEADSLPA